MTYFQDEVWPTQPGTDTNILGSLTSKADPFIIYQGDPATSAISIGSTNLTISRNVNIVGTFTVNGASVATATEDLAPGIFGANEVAGTFEFQNGLNITGNVVITGDDIYLANPANGTGFYFNAFTLGANLAGIDLGYANTYLDIDVDAGGNSIDFAARGTNGGLSDLDIVGATVSINGQQFTPDGWVNIVKSADQDVVNTTTVANDSELFFSVSAGVAYTVSMHLVYAGSDATGDYKFQFAVDTGTLSGRGFASIFNSAQTIAAADLNFNGTAGHTEVVLGTNGPLTYPSVAIINFSFVASANGIVNFKFANSVAGAGRTSRTLKGTILRYKSLA